MNNYLLLLGSNLGDCDKALSTACRLIEEHIGTIVFSSSRIWTPPIGDGVNHDFLNMAIIIGTEMDPEMLLDAVEEIERSMGRDKPVTTCWDTEKRIFSDRIIDIDIAFADFNGARKFDGKWDSKRLRIPHPAIKKRSFIRDLTLEIVPTIGF